MRNLMLAEFLKIKAEQRGFKTSKWKYFAIGGIHISEFEPNGIPTDDMFLVFYNELLMWNASRNDIIGPHRISFKESRIQVNKIWQDLIMQLVSSTFLIESVTITDRHGQIWTMEYFKPATGAIRLENIVSGEELNERTQPPPIYNFDFADIEFTNIPKTDNQQIFRQHEN